MVDVLVCLFDILIFVILVWLEFIFFCGRCEVLEVFVFFFIEKIIINDKYCMFLCN